MPDKAVIGVDPGATGCVAALTESRQLYFVRLGQYDRREWANAIKPLFRFNIVKVLQERTHGRRGDKPNKAETFGRNTGSIETCLWLHMPADMEIEYIQDQVWQRRQAVAGIKDRGDRIRRYQEKSKLKFPNEANRITQDAGAGILIAVTAWDMLWGF